jgi:putative DNA primase/helicase
MKIPIQLKDLKFCRVRDKSKAPFESNWVNKPYSYEEICNFKNENYGILCGYNNLAVIDCDREELSLIIDTLFPKTFTVQTGGGGKHFYFIIPDLEKKIILNAGEQHLGEIQFRGQQVVGSGSTHPNGKKYKLLKDVKISEISYKFIKEHLDNFIKKEDYTLNTQTTTEDYSNLIEEISKKWKKGNRQDLALITAGYLRKEKRLGINTVKYIITKVCEITKDTEINMRLNAIVQTYKKDEVKIKGIKGFIEYNIKDKENLQQEIITQIALRHPRDATEIIVKHFLDKFYIYSTRDDEKSEMWIYENGIYVPQGVSYIKEFCRLLLGKVYTTTLANEVAEKIRVETFINAEEFFKTKYIYEIPILDGILDIRTREINPYDPQKIFFNKIPLNYVPEQRCPLITQFFKDILPNEDDLKVIFEIFGFLLLKDYTIEKAIMFNGVGRNGKTKTLKLMENFIGNENVCNVPIGSMNKDNFDLEDLFGKLLNSAGDVGKTSLKDTGCFKELTGRDGVNLKRKFKRTLRFVNYAKHIFACNELPQVYDNTEGFWSKWVLIDFPFEFKTKREILDLPKDQQINKKEIDLNILEKISTQEELNGLLNEALNGLDRLFKNKDFSYTKGTEYIKTTWKRRANSFLAFCEDNIKEDEKEYITKFNLRKQYGSYCKKHNLKSSVSDKSIKWILENDYYVGDDRIQGERGQIRVWKGIKFKWIL